MPTTMVGILTFMSGTNFVLSRVEHEKTFITFGPGLNPKMMSGLAELISVTSP